MALSAMKKQDDNNLLRDARPILNLKKDTIGTEYTLPSGPIGTTVRVYKDKPKEHHVTVPNKGTKIMSKQDVTDYITTNTYAKDSPLKELYLKQNTIKAGKEELKKTK
jgi:hypothetical protein